MSETVFRREFRSVYGKSPADYLRGIRLARALELIARSSLSAFEIAHATGFQDEFYLFRVLKAKTGRTFREIRAAGEPGFPV